MKSISKVQKNILWSALGAGTLLLVPLTAMQFSREVNWSPFDFAAAWIMLFGAGATYSLIAGKINNGVYKAAVGLAVFTALFMVWANLAVGLIGNENNPANSMYLGVLAVAFLGSIIVNFKPKGMIRVLELTALAQVLVAAIALGAGLQNAPGSSVGEIIGVNGFFAMLWIGSAMLFRIAQGKN